MVLRWHLLSGAVSALLLLLLGAPSSTSSEATGGKLAVLNLGGFRWDYVERLIETEAPNFFRLRADGSRAEWVHPGFPAVSLPSWTSIATGQERKKKSRRKRPQV